MLKAAIVGCGNIAGFLDKPDQPTILTHAHAYTSHPSTELIAVCDPDLEQRRKLVARWGQDIRHYETLGQMLKTHKIDILSICSPTPFHSEAMIAALKDPSIQTIICEKPFVQTQEELDELKILMHIHPKKVLINFMRRFDPSLQQVKLLIDSKDLGKIHTFNGRFTKGLYHNGSHMLDLVEMLCGEITGITALQLESGHELYGNFALNTTNTQGVLQNFTGDNYALFELEIILSKGRILISESGHTICVETVTPSHRYTGYFQLGNAKTYDDTMEKNLYNTLNTALKEKDNSFTSHLKLSQKLLDIQQSLQESRRLEWKIDG